MAINGPATGPKTAAQAVAAPLPESRSLQTDRSRPFDATELLARLWKQNLPLMRERVALLESVAGQVHDGILTDPTRTEAANVAHKLAGSLGMFGFPQGTVIARQLEDILEADGAPDPEQLAQLSADLRLALPL